MTRKENIQSVALELIDRPTRSARFEVDPEKVQELAQSIREVGQLQPILLRPQNGRFEIVAGDHRFLACKSLKLKSIFAVVKEQDDATCIIARATENLARVDLTAVEEAQIYHDLINVNKLSIDEVAKRMGRSAGVIKRRLDILKMPPQLQKAIHEKKISWSVAEELWSLGDGGAIDYYLGFCIDHGATKEVVRQWVHEWKAQKRQAENAGGGGGLAPSPFEARPVFVSCDVCFGPMEIGTETVLRCCDTCTKTIKEALKGG